jgi:hypothetical protein
MLLKNRSIISFCSGMQADAHVDTVADQYITTSSFVDHEAAFCEPQVPFQIFMSLKLAPCLQQYVKGHLIPL